MDSFFVEIILRMDKSPISTRQALLLTELHSYMVFESDDKIVFNVSASWSGFKDGTIISMQKEFAAIYVALAYFSMYENENVTDFDGNKIDSYDAIYNGQRTSKFVKKKIQIVKIIDTLKDVFTVKRYVLDLKFTDPVLKVLDLYSDASNGGISSKEFIK